MGKELQQKSNIVYIEPNEFAELSQKAENGVSRNNISWNPEDLQFTVDLCVEKNSRFDRSSNTKHNSAEWDSFMSGEALRTDEHGAAINSLTDAYTNISYTEYTSTGKSSKELLGIDSIDIDFSSHFYPQVKMRMTDVHGASLFQPSELNYQINEIKNSKRLSEEGKEERLSGIRKDISQSFFKSLFHFPYPQFRLTIKGFYGDKVTFILSVSDFKSSFNSQTGNFDVEIQFIGYMYGLYTDIPMNLIFTAPYYNSEYWEAQKKSGIFKFYDAKENSDDILTFPEFLDKYAHIIENIDSSKLGEHENIMELKGLKDKYNALSKLQRNYNNTVNQVLDKNKKYSVTGKKYNAYVFASEEDVRKQFRNSISIIEALNENLTETSVIFKEESDDYTWLTGFKFPNDPQICYTIKKDGEFNPDLNGKFNELKEENIIPYLEKYSLKNDGYVYLYSKSDFEDKLATTIKDLTDKIEKKKESSDEDIEQIITDALGFKLSVENVYRMIFAHIDTFMNSFTSCIDDIETKRDEQKRTVGYLGLDERHSDLPKSCDDLTYVPPFPAVLDNNRRMIFPKNSNKQELMEMSEVKYVDNIVKSIENYTSEAEKAISYLNGQTANENEDYYSGDYNLKFDPIVISDIYYAMNGKNPYEYLKEYMDKEDIKAEYIIYFIYCRILMAYVVYNDMFQGTTNTTSAYKSTLFGEICKREVNNCLKYFNDYGIDLPKEDILKYTNEIIAKNGDISGTKLSEILKNDEGKLYPFTDGTIAKNLLFSLDFTNPFNKFSNSGSKMAINDESDEISKIDATKKDLSDFSSKLDELLSANTYNFTNGFYKEKKDNDCYVRIRNAESYDKNGEYFILTDNKKIKTKTKNELTEAEKGETFVNLGITKDSEDLDTIFSKMLNEYDNNGTDALKKYYTGLLSYGDIKNNKGENLFVSKDYAHRSLANALENSNSTGSTKNDQMAAIMYLATMASYFNSYYGQHYRLPDFEWELMAAKYNFIVCPNIILLYYGGLSYFYEKFNEFKTARDIISGFTHNDNFYNVNADDKRTWFDFIDTNNNVLVENNVPLYMVNWNESSIARADEILSYAKDKFEAWYYDNNGWGKTKSILIENDNDKPIYSLGKQYDTVPLWKHNEKEDKFIKEELCKTSNIIKINAVYNENISLGQTRMYGIMYRINEAFKNYETESERMAKGFNDEVSENEEHKDNKQALYYTLKNLFDKWMPNKEYNKFTLRNPKNDRDERNRRQTVKKGDMDSEFNSFLYVDSFYRDISSSYIINPDTLVEQIKSYISNGQINKNNSVYEFMAEVAEKNKLLMMALPVYNNFYDLESIKSIFTPNVLYSKKGDEYKLGVGNTYLLMYTGEVSNKLGIDGGDYQDDAVDLFGMDEFKKPVTYLYYDKDNENSVVVDGVSNEGEFTVPVFGVTYAKQNQMYFKSININMDNPQVTDYSLANLIQISYGGAHGDVNQRFGVGQNVYSIYSNRSYTCSVEMMGCMNIMPLMYFQLNNIPMFRGLYCIIKVSHSIRAGNMVTKFTGVRVNKNQLADCKLFFDFQSIYNKINKIDNAVNISGVEGVNGMHFTVENLIYSSTAEKKHINNNPTHEDLVHLQELLDNIVNPLAEAWGRGMKITSGYRSAKLNEEVNGSKTSAHSYGYAVDLQSLKQSENNEFRKFAFEWLNNNNIEYDQFIYEIRDNKEWTHIGYKHKEYKPRKMNLYYNDKLGDNYYDLKANGYKQNKKVSSFSYKINNFEIPC